MQLADLFDHSLKGRADRVGLECERPGAGVKTFTFGELDARANRMARALAARGACKGARVAVQLVNGVDFLDLFLACVKLGAIFVPINVLYREREIGHIVADAEPVLAVSSDERLALFPPGTTTVDVGQLETEAAAQDGGAVRTVIDGDDVALLVYTSGTTGRSKGAALTHNNVATNAANVTACWRVTSEDRYLGVLPLFHVHGLGNGVTTWLLSGCRMRLVERFVHQEAAALFDAFQPTLFFGVPTIYVRLLELDTATARRIGQHARLFVCGSAPLPAQVLDAFRQRFGHTILERYGMSETLMNIGNPYEGERRAGTVGLPFPGVSARIVNEEGALVPDGTVGFLELRGSNVFGGYWRDAEATAAAFRDGWFRTCDLAERSADGYYTLRGRSSDLIISGGFNIYPREIEELLLEQPGVREVSVVGASDPRRGEVPVAYVVCDGPLNEAALHDACAGGLASFKLPRAFIRVESLPRTALGKVQKHLLPPWSPA